MKELNFDENGLLIPNQLIESTINEIKFHLVDNIGNDTRKHLFKVLERFIEMLKTVYLFELEVWIDGSFVTQKAEPRDIDIVVIVPFDVYEESIFKGIQSAYRKYGLDLYALIKYPVEHKKIDIFESDRLYWYHLFTKTKRRNRTKKSYSKGFLKLMING